MCIDSGEGDRLGGLIVDILGKVVVIQSSSYWTEFHRGDVEYVLKEALGDSKRYVWRRAESRLKQDGFNITDTERDGVDGDVSDPEPEIVLENNVRYLVSPDEGQKTGFYCDQRANRVMIRELCAGKTVLDTYCYTGGFSINAAVGGAVKVTAVDSSQPAIDAGKANVKLNGVEGVVEFVKADAEQFMATLKSQGQKFDVVICDPPKLAPTRNTLDRAKNK